jgi:EmrB/QacA subfamily drug resistance transporter
VVVERRVLSILMVSAVLIWIDATVLGIALQRIADPVTGLGASPGQLQWAVGAYSLLFATALFAAGALGDRYGHRTILLAGLATFGAASAWAAWAGGPVELVAARAVMGAGGAMIMPSSMAIIGATFEPARRAGAIAAWSASSGAGVAAGPVLGGVLIDHFWWGSVFLINVPVVVFGLVFVRLYVPNPRHPQRRRFDPVGLALSTVGLFGLTYGLIEGGQSGWRQVWVWGSVAVGLVLLGTFVITELRAAQPSFDMRLFRNRRFAAGNVALAALFLTITGQSFWSTFFLQGAVGLDPLEAGLMGLPGALGVVFGAPLGARLARRYGVRAVSGPALLLFAGCMATNLTFQVGTSLWWFGVVGAVAGLTIGITVAPASAAVIAALPLAQMGAGSAVNNALRQVGSVLGVAVLGTVLADAYQRATAQLGLPDAGFSTVATSPAAANGFVHAMHVTALCAAGFASAGAVALIGFMRRPAPEAAPVAVDSPIPPVPQPV